MAGGGLDTSIILAWLIEKGYEVVCFMAGKWLLWCRLPRILLIHVQMSDK